MSSSTSSIRTSIAAGDQVSSDIHSDDYERDLAFFDQVFFLSFLCAFFYHFVFAISSTVGQKEEKSVKVPVPVRTKYDFDYSPQTNGWLTGRATYFDASYEGKQSISPITSSATSRQMDVVTRPKNTSNESQSRCRLEFQENAVAALATFEMKSSCGQCYEVKCDDEVTKIRKSFRQNDFIEYNDNFTRF